MVFTHMRGAVIPTSAHQGIPTTFALRRGITVPRFVLNLFASMELEERIMFMKQLKISLLILILFGFANCANAASTSEDEQTSFPFKLYPTDNMWTFIKLDTRNGKMWQVQFSVEGDDYRFEMPLNTIELSSGSKSDRFELYPTKNMFNFMLLDRITGDTWQVQWSTKPEEQAVIPIKQPYYYENSETNYYEDNKTKCKSKF